MAKKKNSKTKRAAQKDVIKKQDREETSVIQDETSMRDKVEVKHIDRDRERISRLVGSLFIGIGVLLVAFGIYAFIRFREKPVLDNELEAPVLEEVTSLTNGEEITVRGTAQGYETVYVYVNDEFVNSANVEDGQFSYQHTVSSQGDLAVSVAGVKGFPSRIISPRSETKIATVDWTPPSTEDVALTYGSETNKETFALVGTAEPSSKVVVKRGTDSYEGVADDGGRFRIGDIQLDEGRNVFTVYIEDKAGNRVELDEKIRVTYNPAGDVNGDAVVDGKDLPQAAGELDFLIGNKLMMLFGILALLAFAGSSGYMYYKRK